MSNALHTAPSTGSMRKHYLPSGCAEVCEETGERSFRAGEYAAPGEYEEVETGRSISLKAPGFLPARLDGQVGYYRLARRSWAADSDQRRQGNAGGTSRAAGEARLAARQVQFQLLVGQVHQRLYNFARRAPGNSQDAEDITQETLARAWNHFDTFDANRSFEVWVFRIARNLLIDHSRRRRRRQEVSLDAPWLDRSEKGNEREGHAELADSRTDPARRLLHEQFNEDLYEALQFLPPIHRATMLLVAEKHSYEQIANAFACPVGTVRSRIYRARRLLRSSLNAKVSQ